MGGKNKKNKKQPPRKQSTDEDEEAPPAVYSRGSEPQIGVENLEDQKLPETSNFHI